MGLHLPRMLPYSAAEVLQKGHRDRTDYPQGLNSHRHNGMTWGQAVVLCKLPCLCPGGHCSCTTGGSSAKRPCQGVWAGCIPNQGLAILPGDQRTRPDGSSLDGICADVIARYRMSFMAEWR